MKKTMKVLLALGLSMLAVGGSSMAFAQGENNGKSAVVYFSASGVTRTVAKNLGAALGAEVFELTPAVPYSGNDLNYRDSSSRCVKENNTANARPALAGDYSAVLNYDTIYLGFPVWWNKAPKIVNTFTDKYNLAGKKVYVFVTSGGSGVSGSFNTLKREYLNVEFVKGKELERSSSGNELANW